MQSRSRASHANLINIAVTACRLQANADVFLWESLGCMHHPSVAAAAAVQGCERLNAPCRQSPPTRCVSYPVT